VDYGPVPASGMQIATGPDGSCGGSYSVDTPTGRSLYNGVVVHKAPEREAGRWTWLKAPAEEQLGVEPSCASDLCSNGDQVLVELYPPNVDVEDRVPLDRAMCATGGRCELVYPSGNYQVVVWGSAGELTRLESESLVAGQAFSVEL